MERRILVVEDSPTQAEQLRLLLVSEGYRVDVAGNGRKGLEQVQLEQPDLIISDVVMPEMDGYAFCQAVKSNPRTKRIPFVLLTQQNTPNDIVWGLQQGADNFITKPFDDDYLLERVRRIFENLAFREKGHLEVEVTLRIGNRDIVISADKQQIVELLFATFEDLKRVNDQLIESQQKVKEYAKTLEAKVEARTAQVYALYHASLEIQEPLRLKDRLNRLLQTAKEVLDLDRVNILLADREARWLEGVASLGTEEPLEAIRVPIGQAGGVIARAYLTRQPLFWDGREAVPHEWRLQPPYDQIEAFRSRVFANVPLVVQGKAIGVLGADREYSRRPFEPDMRELLQLFASQAALAIGHARLYEELQLAAVQLEAKVEERTRELRAANLELERASRFKSEFLANMSHELRTPLNSIIGFSELLEDQQFGPLNEKQERYMHNIWTSGRHLLDLINDILDLSKVEAGKIELHMETFSLREALVAALTMVRPQAVKRKISLRSEIVPEMTTVTADPVRFKQIMYNLLSNAIKFTPEGGQVSVAASTVEDAFVEIAVTDTGIGIKAEDVPRLFQEFIQLDSFLGKQHEGTGLGLALTKRLVELHGGKIWAESLGPGQGTTVTLTLPITAPTSSVTS